MNLTNTTDPLEVSAQVAYKTETAPEMLYYQVRRYPSIFFFSYFKYFCISFLAQNTTTEVNQTGDGFFPSIFNDDDLQLMDMAMTDSKPSAFILEPQN